MTSVLGARSVVRIPGGVRYLFLLRNFLTVLMPTHLPIQRVLGFFSGATAVRVCSWPLSTFCAEVKNECSYNFTLHIRLHGAHKEKFTFYFTLKINSVDYWEESLKVCQNMWYGTTRSGNIVRNRDKVVTSVVQDVMGLYWRLGYWLATGISPFESQKRQKIFSLSEYPNRLWSPKYFLSNRYLM